MAFKIVFTEEPDEYLHDDPHLASGIGLMVAGNLTENFVSVLYDWDKRAYRSQWFDALRHLLNGGDRAALIISYVAPDVGQCWALYRGEGELVHVQQHHTLLGDNGPAKFSVGRAHSFMMDRETADEDGHRISEWDVGLVDVQHFFDHFDELSGGDRRDDWITYSQRT